jgi:glycosyltransferase involved in cell wall biosynthesis
VSSFETGRAVHMSTHDLPQVVFVLEKPVQHYSESFRQLTRSRQARVSIIYWTDSKGGQFDPGFGRHVSWDVDLLSGYRWQRVTGTTTFRRTANFLTLIHELDPNVVVCVGWATGVARLAIVWCVISRTPFVFFGDTTWQHSERPRLRWLRAILLRIAFRLAAGALSTGTFNREFYIQFGMHPSRVFDSVYPIDVASYARGREERSKNNGQGTVIGFAGKLIRRKGADELLRALGLISKDDRWRARIIGDGEERGRLEALARSLGIANRVEFRGFRNTSEMPLELASCDIVVVPSTFDMRVVVAAEAMMTGAAVIVSSNTAVWGKGDLVEEGVTGRVYQSGDEGELASILEELVEKPLVRAALQAAGAERAAGQGPEAFTRGLERAVTAIWRDPNRRFWSRSQHGG